VDRTDVRAIDLQASLTYAASPHALQMRSNTMASDDTQSRRRFVKKLLLGAGLTPLATARLTASHAAELPLLSPDDPEAKKVKYTEDATKEKSAVKGNNCGNCALYEGTYKSARGPCQIFPGKDVKSAGWCSSWAPQL
jgi:High potential iron-sulfur protein